MKICKVCKIEKDESKGIWENLASKMKHRGSVTMAPVEEIDGYLSADEEDTFRLSNDEIIGIRPEDEWEDDLNKPRDEYTVKGAEKSLKIVYKFFVENKMLKEADVVQGKLGALSK